jgi:tetratricopeptide (TPR) repeat protein
MVTPGLLPEADDRRPSPLRWILPLVIVGLIVAVFTLIRENQVILGKMRHLDAARDAAVPPSVLKEDVGRIRELEAQIAELRKSTPPPPPPPDAVPAKAPDLRVLPPDLAAERLTQGQQHFRSGRYMEAEACFLRAIPEGFLYLALSCVARGDIREASLFLARAMKEDPQWLRRFRPRDLFGSAEEFERALKGLEDRVKENPLDGEAKTVLAYLHFHEKGAEYAKALMTEVAAAQPADPAPKAFLDALEKP